MKGQTQQVFIYIMVILVVGGVLLFGYKSINNILNKQCDVDDATFQNQLKIMLEKNTGYGDKSTKPIKSSCGYDTLCFVDSNTSSGNINIGALETQYPLIAQEVSAGTGNNVFLVKGKETKALYALDYIVVPGNATGKGFTCVQSKGSNFYLVLEGVGKGKVSIKQTTG